MASHGVTALGSSGGFLLTAGLTQGVCGGGGCERSGVPEAPGASAGWIADAKCEGGIKSPWTLPKIMTQIKIDMH